MRPTQNNKTKPAIKIPLACSTHSRLNIECGYFGLCIAKNYLYYTLRA